MQRKKYNVEFISTETGEESQKLYIGFSDVQELMLSMQEGDDMVIHCLGPQPDLHI